MKRRILSCTGACVLLALGCGDGGPSATDPTVSGPSRNPTVPSGVGSTDDDSPSVSNPGVVTPTSPGNGIPLPTDTRPPVNAETAPPPISGGTLIITSDGLTAVAADPDRDRIMFVDLRRAEVLSELTLEPGDEPGRLTEDGAGRIHVALRGAGELASIDLAKRALIERRAVCATPRGIAYERGSDSLHVACVDGQLVTLPAAGGRAIRERNLGTDLRDVIMTNAGLRVSRFRAAEVLEVDNAGELLDTRALHNTRQVRFNPMDGSAKDQSFTPTLARRAVAMNGDSVLVLHERALNDTIELEDPHDQTGGMVDTGLPPGFPGGEGGSAYGGGGECTSIVQSALSVVDGSGKVTHSMSLGGIVLPVDVAVSSDGRMIAVADAGQRDANSPLRNDFFGKVPGVASGGVGLFNIAQQPMVESEDLGAGCMIGSIPVEGNQPTAVAFTPDGTLVVQSRQPARLALFSADGLKTIELGGVDRTDTGHEIFHRDAGAGIACASCHGEGGDDGHVWNFSTLGPRRTQSVNVGLANTEPFHWSGDMADLKMIMSEVFVDRMGGVPQSDARIGALSSWIFALTAPAAPRAQNDDAALRGQHLFESEAVGCTGCHSGEKLTNNKTVDVGTGEPLQVPSLVGIAYRAPFIHTGCANTLHDRFDPACGGGDKHGKTSQLSGTEIDDLVAYLETL
jgi:mono/diheme cytochrome c family protein